MRLACAALAFGIGLIIALHFSMNSAVGKAVANPRMGNAVFWLIGASVAVLIGSTGWSNHFWSAARTVPLWLWTAGALGATLVFGVISLIPRLGAATTNIALLAGQIIGGIIIGHFGLLGSPQEPLNAARITGALLAVLGAILVGLGRFPVIR